MEEEKNNDYRERHEHEKKDSKRKGELTEKMRANPWILSTLVLGVLTLVLIVSNFGGMNGSIISGKVISENDAGDKILEFVNSQVDEEVELVEVNTKSGLYEVIVLFEGNEVPVYITADGENLVQGLTPLDIIMKQTNPTSSETIEVPKSDKPEVELFIWGYCPYGVQAQGPLAEVASLLGDYADFKAVLYYDGHGPFETQENKIQECIQQVAPDKYWDYAAGFVEDIYPKCSSSRDVECDKTEAVKLMNSLGINSNEVLSCVDSQGEDLISEASDRAKELSVSGSPTLIVNGVKVNAARTSEAFKTAVCEAFNDAPEECSTVLDDSASTASGNC